MGLGCGRECVLVACVKEKRKRGKGNGGGGAYRSERMSFIDSKTE
jgi:hypothetical protein